MESCSATLTAFIGLALSKKTQNAAAAAGKGIASAAEQASNAAQSAADQTGQAIGNIAGKAKGAIQSIGDAIEDGSEQKSIKYNTEFGRRAKRCRIGPIPKSSSGAYGGNARRCG